MAAKRAPTTAKSKRGFRPASGNTENVSRWAICTRFHAGSKDAANADPRNAGVCGKRGWTITIQIKEVGSGAVDRELREELMAAARRRGIDVVLVWRLDRWGRSLADLVVTLKELSELGVGFVSLTEALDLTTPTGRAMAGLLSVFAEFERDILRERIRAGIVEARRKGIKLGRPVTASKKAAQVRKLHRAGVSKAEIARQLNIGRTSVRRILSTSREHDVLAGDRGVSMSPRAEPEPDPLIYRAIEQRRLLRLRYQGKERIVEPHDYGVHNGTVKLFTYQVGAASSQKLPNWRWIETDQASDVQLLSRTFPGGRPTKSGKHHNGTNCSFE